jgi:hypothetical protein
VGNVNMCSCVEVLGVSHRLYSCVQKIKRGYIKLNIAVFKTGHNWKTADAWNTRLAKPPFCEGLLYHKETKFGKMFPT